MTKTLAQRAAPLLVTTLLFAAPALAQTASANGAGPGCAVGHPVGYQPEGNAARQPCTVR